MLVTPLSGEGHTSNCSTGDCLVSFLCVTFGIIKRMIRVRSRQFKQLERWVIKHRVPLGITLGALVFVISYTTYMASKRLTVDQQSYQPLLGLIGQAESRGNYNAYFGNAGNKKVQFTTMTIQEVLAWQDSYVRQGSPSSAVGRHQFLNTTLAGLVRTRH